MMILISSQVSPAAAASRLWNELSPEYLKFPNLPQISSLINYPPSTHPLASTPNLKSPLFRNSNFYQPVLQPIVSFDQSYHSTNPSFDQSCSLTNPVKFVLYVPRFCNSPPSLPLVFRQLGFGSSCSIFRQPFRLDQCSWISCCPKVSFEEVL